MQLKIHRICNYNDPVTSRDEKGQEFVHCFCVFAPSYFEIYMHWN